MGMVVVGLSEMKISTRREDELVTFALGSCLGVAVYDQRVPAGGMLHVMLPSVPAVGGKHEEKPFMYVESAIPLFLNALYAHGVRKNHMVVKVAGGSCTQQKDVFEIGKRNILMLRKELWKNDIAISNEDVGGNRPRTMHLAMDTGRTWLQSDGSEWEL